MLPVGREFEAKEKSAHQKRARGADKHVALELRTESPASDKAERRRWDRILPTEFRIVVVRAGKHEEICQRGRGRVRNLRGRPAQLLQIAGPVRSLDLFELGDAA